MRRTRHVIAVMVVATALCADRAAVSAAPAQARSAAPKSLAARIATSFRQTVPSVRLQPTRTMESATSFPLPIRATASGVRSEFSPFQFRLPPPLR